VEFEKFCTEVLALDKNIRYVGVYYKSRLYVKMREGVVNLLTPQETEKSLHDAYSRWETRMSLAPKIGKPLYAMAEYEKIKRITIPFAKRGIVLISMEPKAYHEIITKEVIEIVEKYFSESDK
jgi:hypothetical protein